MKKAELEEAMQREQQELDQCMRDATARIREFVKAPDHPLLAGQKWPIPILSKYFHANFKSFYRLFNDNDEIIDDSGNTSIQPIKINLSKEIIRSFCYNLMEISIHELFFGTTAPSLIPQHLVPSMLELKKKTFDERAAASEHLTGIANQMLGNGGRILEGDPNDTFYQAIDEIISNQSAYSIQHLAGFNLLSSHKQVYFEKKMTQKSPFQMIDILSIAKHQHTSVDRFMSNLYFEHTPLALLVDGEPLELSKFDFFGYRIAKAYVQLNDECKKAFLPQMLRTIFGL